MSVVCEAIKIIPALLSSVGAFFMGGGGSKTETKTEYVQDPETKAALEEYRTKNAELLDKFTALQEEMRAEKLDSFDKLQAHDKKKADALIQLAAATQPLTMQGDNNIGFFGQTSTGKSSLINTMMRKPVAKTGEAETTLEPAGYPSSLGGGFTLWDMPGKNDDLSYFSLEYIGFWKALSRRVILLQADVKEMTSVIRLMDALSLSYLVVVNRRQPKDDSEEKKTAFVQQLTQELNAVHPLREGERIYCIHAEEPDRYRDDWLALMNELLPGGAMGEESKSAVA